MADEKNTSKCCILAMFHGPTLGHVIIGSPWAGGITWCVYLAAGDKKCVVLAETLVSIYSLHHRHYCLHTWCETMTGVGSVSNHNIVAVRMDEYWICTHAHAIVELDR
jgi:hypothetical protein